jgi:hypothetical protein
MNLCIARQWASQLKWRITARLCRKRATSGYPRSVHSNKFADVSRPQEGNSERPLLEATLNLFSTEKLLIRFSAMAKVLGTRVHRHGAQLRTRASRSLHSIVRDFLRFEVRLLPPLLHALETARFHLMSRSLLSARFTCSPSGNL